MRTTVVAVLLVVVGACSEPPVPADAGVDGGVQLADAGLHDAGLTDAGIVDAGSIDAGVVDAGVADAGSLDAGTTDAGTTDAGLSDAGSVDAGSIDAGFVDAGARDAGATDGGSSDAGARDAGPADAGVRFAYIIPPIRDPDGIRLAPSWTAAASAYVSSVDASIVQVGGFGFGWDSLIDDGGALNHSVDGGLALLRQLQLALQTNVGAQYMLAVDVEGAVVPLPGQSQQQAPQYSERLGALHSLLSRFTAEFGPSRDGGRPMSFYGAFVGAGFYFDEPSLRAYRSPRYPSGYPFDAGEYNVGNWRWNNVALSHLRQYATVGGGPFEQSFAPYTDGGLLPLALADFLEEYGNDWMVGNYGRPEWQPLLRLQDVISPSYYLIFGFPDVEFLPRTMTTAPGPLQGLGGESAYHYRNARELAAWIERQPDKRRALIPYVGGFKFAVKNEPGPTGFELWDVPDWSADAGRQWLDASRTHVTEGQVRASFPEFINSLQGMDRGAREGGHPLDGIYLWDSYTWLIGNARLYVTARANGTNRPELFTYFDQVVRMVKTEWAIGLPGDAVWLAPLFGGQWDRRAVFGPLATKPATQWTVQDLDDAAVLLFRVRQQAYLEAARSVFH